jgi:hypothetical protein
MKALSVGISSSFAQKNSIFFLLKTISYLLLIMGSLLIEKKSISSTNYFIGGNNMLRLEMYSIYFYKIDWSKSQIELLH